MRHTPKLSVITVCLNAANSVERLIQTVLNQSFCDYEFLVVDGASSDGTIEILKKYSFENSLSFVSEKDNGIYEAMNKGLDMAQGEWVYFIGSDDTLYHDRVFENIFEHDTDGFDVIYGNVEFVLSGLLYDGPFDQEKISKKNICHQALFIKKKLFKELGSFETKYKISADYEFNLRWMGRNVSSKYVGETIARFNEKGVSGTTSDPTFVDNFDLLLQENKIISKRSFEYLLNRNRRLENSYRYRLGSFLVSPLNWIKNKVHHASKA